MSDFIGSLITKANTVPTATSASGRWTVTEAAKYIAKGTWPVPITPDPYFDYTTLLLPGNGVNGGQNNTFLDSSSNGFTITRVGNATQGSLSPYGNLWSTYFDGADDYIETPSNAAFAYGTGDFTIEFWIYLNDTSGTPVFIESRNGVTSALVPLIYLNTSSIRYYTGGSDRITGPTLTVGVWYHVAAARSGTSTKLFVGGSQVGTTYTDTNNYVQNPVRIGHSTTTTSTVNGYISNLRILKGTALYTSNFTPSTTPLTAISGTSLLTCQSNRFIDNSNNNFALTIAGNPSVQRFSAFNPTAIYDPALIGGSGYFDGAGDRLSIPSNVAFEMGTSNFTWECWTYITSFGNGFAMMSHFTSGTGARVALWVSPTEGLSCDTGGGLALTFSVVTAITIPLRTWTHCTMVRSGSTFSLYVNGVLNKTATSSASYIPTNQVFTIGDYNSDYATGSGYVADARVVKGSAVYTADFTPPTTPVTNISGTSLLCKFTNTSIIDATAKNDLETVGNAQISTAVKKFGTGSISFDGTGDYLSIPYTPDINITTGDFTIEGWFYFNGVASGQHIFINYTSTSGYGIALYTSATGTLSYYLGSNGTSWNIASAVLIGSIAIGQWYHVALVRSGSTFTPYFNGVAGTTTTSSSALYNGSVPYILGGNPSGGYFNGYIDDFRVTKGIARYTGNFTVPTIPFPTR